LLKYTGIDQVVQNVLKRLGGLEQAWLVGDFARGRDSDTISLLLIGDKINQEALAGYISRVEGMTERKIRYRMIKPEEARVIYEEYPSRLLLFNSIK